jgi:SET domain-containing protein
VQHTIKRCIFAADMLYVKKSKLPKAGKGLFTKEEIKKGAVVCEYEGEKITWKECLRRNENQTGKGAYYFHVTDKNCIDAQYTLWAMGRYANDATGFSRVAGLRNNARYEVIKNKPYILAIRNIKAGEEIFVSYGKEYWDAMLED